MAVASTRQISHVNNLKTHTYISPSSWFAVPPYGSHIEWEGEKDSAELLWCAWPVACVRRSGIVLWKWPEIFTDFHFQFGFFMWLQSLCNSLASGHCYISSNRTALQCPRLRAQQKSLQRAYVRALRRLNGALLFFWDHLDSSLIGEINFTGGVPAPSQAPGFKSLKWWAGLDDIWLMMRWIQHTNGK